MATAQYIYNPTTALWYPIIATGTGADMATAIDTANGISTPPPYVAETGTPLLTTDYYLAFTQSTQLPCSVEQWTLFAITVSEKVVRYCRQDWRIQAVAVPLPVQMATAFIIRDLIVSKNTNTGLFKSYSAGDYSWTLQDGVTAGDIIAPYAGLLNDYREWSIYA